MKAQDKVQHRETQVVGTITETSNRTFNIVYRVEWEKEVNGRNYTWHYEDELQKIDNP